MIAGVKGAIAAGARGPLERARRVRDDPRFLALVEKYGRG
jgi:hypothetical protein